MNYEDTTEGMLDESRANNKRLRKEKQQLAEALEISKSETEFERREKIKFATEIERLKAEISRLRGRFVEIDRLEQTISGMSDVIGSLSNVLGDLLFNLDPYQNDRCIVCGFHQSEDHADDCSYIAAKKEWQLYQPPDDDRSMEDLS